MIFFLAFEIIPRRSSEDDIFSCLLCCPRDRLDCNLASARCLHSCHFTRCSACSWRQNLDWHLQVVRREPALLSESVVVPIQAAFSLLLRFNDQKGFGFIDVDGEEMDLFVHQSVIYASGFR